MRVTIHVYKFYSSFYTDNVLSYRNNKYNKTVLSSMTNLKLKNIKEPPPPVNIFVNDSCLYKATFSRAKLIQLKYVGYFGSIICLYL